MLNDYNIDTCFRFERHGCNGPVKPTLAELAGIQNNLSKNALDALFLDNESKKNLYYVLYLTPVLSQS